MCKSKEEKAEEKRVIDATRRALQQVRHRINDLDRGKIDTYKPCFRESYKREMKKEVE